VTSGVAAILFAVFGSSASAQIWNNAGGTGNWLDGANWVGGTAPTGIADDATVGLPSPVLLNGSVNLNSLTVAGDGVINIAAGQNLDFGGSATTTLTNAGTINTSNGSDLQLQNSVDNSGNINVNAAASNTDIEIDSAGATLAGGGTITLSGSNAGINGLSGASLTVVDQTIQGQGAIGENSIQIVNQANGLIDANVNGELLNMDASASGASNSGTMQASGGGVLQFSGSVVDNMGGQIVAQDGSEVRMTSSSFSGGTLSTVGTGQLTVNSGANVGFTDTTIDGNLVSLNGSDSEVSGTITNQGTIQIAAATSNTDIEVQAGGATLTGGGTVQLSGSNAGINGVGTGTVLTIGDQTIEGQGAIGENSIGIVNTSSGLVDANVATQVLQIDANTSDGVDNDGIMQASNEGVLRFFGSIVNNGGGLIEAQADSTVALNNSTITGGTVNSVGSGELTVENGTNVRFEDLSNSGTIASLNGSDTELLGTIDNSGLMEVRASASNTDIEVQTGDATITGGGTIRLTGSNAGINGRASTTLTIGDQTIEGEGSIGENMIGIVNSANGLIDGNVAGSTLQIDASAGGLNNDGVIQSSDQGTLRIIGTDVDNADGLIVAQDLSEIRLHNSTITGGRIDTEFDGEIYVESGTNVRFENLTSTANNMFALNSSDTELLGTFDNQREFEVLATTANTDIEVQSGGATLTGGGSIRLSGNLAGINGVGGSVLDIQSQLIIGEGSLGENSIEILNGPNGTIEADVMGGTLTIDLLGASNATTFTNDGTLRASNGGKLDSVQHVLNNGTIDTGIGSEFETRSLTSSAGSLISGHGSVDVEVGNILVAGTVAPGSSAGTLTFEDNTEFLSTAILETELESDLLFDVLAVNGNLTLDGTLTVDLLGGFNPLSADTFLIATALDVTGEFSNVSDGGLILTEGGEGTFTVNYLSNGVQLSNFMLTAIPEPTSAVVLVGIGLGMALRRRRHV
jgi:hypothetical protein